MASIGISDVVSASVYSEKTRMKKLMMKMKASPTLGCSIEILRDIYMSVGRSVCLLCPRCVGGIM